jgi:hypothetical protein
MATKRGSHLKILAAGQATGMLAGNRMLLRQAPALLPAMRSRSQLVVAMAKKQGKKEAGGAQGRQAGNTFSLLACFLSASVSSGI